MTAAPAGATPPWCGRPGRTTFARSFHETATPAELSCCGYRATTAHTRATEPQSRSCAEPPATRLGHTAEPMPIGLTTCAFCAMCLRDAHVGRSRGMSTVHGKNVHTLRER